MFLSTQEGFPSKTGTSGMVSRLCRPYFPTAVPCLCSRIREGVSGGDIILAHWVSLWGIMPEHPSWRLISCAVRLWEMPTLMGGQGELLARGGISEVLLWSLWLPHSHSPWVAVVVVRNLTQYSSLHPAQIVICDL